MATTTNFGWETPDDTDLVKDGAAAIRTALGGVDTSFVDLKGGTTGQVLAKASDTDLDFIWSADAAGMTNPMTTAGDLIIGGTSGAPDRLGIGTAGQVLKVNSGATAPEWGSVAATKNFTLLNAGGTALTGATTITVSGISGIDELLILVNDASSANASSEFKFNFNGDTASNYALFGQYGASIGGRFSAFSTSGVYFTRMGASAASEAAGFMRVSGCNTDGVKAFTAGGTADNSGYLGVLGGAWKGSGTVTSVSINSSTGNFDKGTIYVYGAA